MQRRQEVIHPVRTIMIITIFTDNIYTLEH